ncbi:phosphoribosyltransferase family protein [Clostridium aestuarii]|uniref:Phosphoribosyltransferase family protein n=1 Tax=Clostridium aestuarii TaxID=338193 RepID=A0ABT4D2R6_9CLOT|nr:phosphoribosyltransferase family protein [Clostridium aestuarii]MCY6484942.1 phosphoribosyltransferase family protein [Clostridium aestuarii]
MKNRLNILNKINVDIKISENPFDFELKDLFLMAARKNPKRAFLFVSTLLGKHIPLNPKKAMLTGKLLGIMLSKKIQNTYRQDFDTKLIVQALKDEINLDRAIGYTNNNLIFMQESTLFIGFAETATALGNTVFSQFQGENVFYIHTTRDELLECNSAFDFEEEHSHATSHFCYPLKEEFLSKFKRVVLVDDEITTGKTALNLIRAINKKYPNKEYVVVSILDWRTEEYMNQYKIAENELEIKIDVISLLKGEVECDSPSIEDMKVEYQNSEDMEINEFYESYYEDGVLYAEFNRNCLFKAKNSEEITTVRNYLFKTDKYKTFTRKLCGGEGKIYDYLNFSGRFGMNVKQLNVIEGKLDKIVNVMRPLEDNILVLGTEEFMYTPMVMASKIDGARYQSTTRSPIYSSIEENYAVKSAAIFKNPFDKDVMNYLYNVQQEMYSEVIFVTERQIDDSSKRELVNLFQNVGILKINFVYFLKN